MARYWKLALPEWLFKEFNRTKILFSNAEEDQRYRRKLEPSQDFTTIIKRILPPKEES